MNKMICERIPMNSMYEVKCDHKPHVAKCMHRFTDPQTTIHRTQKNQHLQKIIFHHFLVSFPCAGAASGTIVTPIGVILSLCCVLLIFGCPRPRKWSPFWRPFRHQNRQRPCKTVEKHGPAQQTKKSSISEATQGGPLYCPDSKYHLF